MSIEAMGVAPVSVATSVSSFAEGVSSGVSAVESTLPAASTVQTALSQTVAYHPNSDTEMSMPEARVTLSAEKVFAMPELIVGSKNTEYVALETLVSEIKKQDQTQLADVRAELDVLRGQTTSEEDGVVHIPVWEGLVLDTDKKSDGTVGTQELTAYENLKQPDEEEFSDMEGVATQEKLDQEEENQDGEEVSQENEEEEKNEDQKEDEEQETDENEKEEEQEEEEEDDEEEEEPPVELGSVVDEHTNKERWAYMAGAAQESAEENLGTVLGNDLAQRLEHNAAKLKSGILRRQMPGASFQVLPAEDGGLIELERAMQGKQFTTQTEALHAASQAIDKNTAVDIGNIRRERPAMVQEVEKVIKGPVPRVKSVRHI